MTNDRFPHSDGIPARFAVASTHGPSSGNAVSVESVIDGSVVSTTVVDVVGGRLSNTSGVLLLPPQALNSRSIPTPAGRVRRRARCVAPRVMLWVRRCICRRLSQPARPKSARCTGLRVSWVLGDLRPIRASAPPRFTWLRQQELLRAVVVEVLRPSGSHGE